MKKIETSGAPAAVGPYSQAIAAGGVLYCSGQIGIDPATGEARPDFEGQVVQIFENLKAVSAAAGCTLADVVKTTCFLTDLSKFPDFNKIYAGYFSEPYPARSTIGISALPKGLLVEVEAIFRIPE